MIEPQIRAVLAPEKQLAVLRRLARQARALADPPISNFAVGAALVGAKTGRVYLGGNIEFPGAAIGQSIHAEQAAFANAWHAGETGIAALVVTAMPCGHCRQFLWETLGPKAKRFGVTVGPRTLRIDKLLPNAFGPADLGGKHGAMSAPPARLAASGDALVAAACEAARRSYAPHTRGHAGLALQLADDSVFAGRYAENAAYNPSLPPLQAALILRHAAGKTRVPIARAVLVAAPAAIDHAVQAEALLALVARGIRLERVRAARR
jgi:cytidine deaminase